jgi:DNA-binding response OmpR family regulator
MRILIVEDHPKLRANLVKLFRGAGYFVDQAIHGLEAMEKIQQQSFDLLILDMNLPIFNGTEVLQKLRSKENPIPILVLTSNNFPGDIVKVLDMGADDYLTKPFDIDQLFARVRAILRRNTAILPQQIVDIGVLKIDISYHEVFFE